MDPGVPVPCTTCSEPHMPGNLHLMLLFLFLLVITLHYKCQSIFTYIMIKFYLKAEF